MSGAQVLCRNRPLRWSATLWEFTRVQLAQSSVGDDSQHGSLVSLLFLPNLPTSAWVRVAIDDLATLQLDFAIQETS